MNKKIFLHIGLPKTGTTYLQCQIQFNRNRLRSSGIYVPKIGQQTGRDHNMLALALQPERWEQFPTEISKKLPSLWPNFLTEIDNCGCNSILVTSEALSWELKSQEQIKSVRDHLINFDVKIALCERNPYDFISSMYGHMIRTGRGPYSIDSFLIEFPYFWSAAYQKNRWAKYFGENNFILLSYEDLKGDSIFIKFLNKLFPDHSVLLENFEFSPDLNRNTSFSPRFLKFMEELSINKIDSSPYVDLYLKIVDSLVPIERKILQINDIDAAMTRCGMEIEFRPSNQNKLIQQHSCCDASAPVIRKDNDQPDVSTHKNIETSQIVKNRLQKRLKSSSNIDFGAGIFQKCAQWTLGSWDDIKKTLSNLINDGIYDMTAFKDIKSILSQTLELIGIAEQRTRTIEHIMNQYASFAKIVEERTKTIEYVINQHSKLIDITERRSRTIEYIASQSFNAAQFQIDHLQKFYQEFMPIVFNFNNRVAFNASKVLCLNTDFPIAADSNDHLSPDSTTEGLSRPTFFVQDCIRVLGKQIKCLDLGCGGAGLIFEFAMNEIFAVGVDGSDFCRVNRIGYWPLLHNNLFTCDITKPFSFKSQDTKTSVQFDLITAWEVLEHIHESDLPILFSNIRKHLSVGGYFLGSISLIEYADSNGVPYHKTLKPREWWNLKLKDNNLQLLDAHPFNEDCFCRGNGRRFQDFHNYKRNPHEGFWFVVQKKV